MKQFINIIVVLLVTVSVVSAGERRHDNYRGGRDCNIGCFLLGALTVCAIDSTLVERNVQPIVVVSEPVGHWKTVVVAYETVLKPVYHAPVFGTYRDGQILVRYEKAPGYTEMRATRVPITQQVWVE